MTATPTAIYAPPPQPTPMAIVGTILALGVIRLIEGQDLLDKLTEERVSTDVLTTKEKTP